MSTTARNTKSKIRFSALSFLAVILAMAALPTLGYAAEIDKEETQAEVIFTAGSLALDFAPAFSFETAEITSAAKVIKATGTPGPLQVTDLRGTAAGWDLNVSLSKFTTDSGTIETLQGSFISLTSAAVSGVNETVGTPPIVPTTVKIDSGNVETLVFSAEPGAGMGSWKSVWGAANVELTVLPGTAHAGTNTAKLTWSLQATP